MNYKQKYEYIKERIGDLTQRTYMESKENEHKRLSKLNSTKEELDVFINEMESDFNKQVALNGDGPELDNLYMTIQFAKNLK